MFLIVQSLVRCRRRFSMEKTKAAKEHFGKFIPNPKLKLLDQVREIARLELVPKVRIFAMSNGEW